MRVKEFDLNVVYPLTYTRKMSFNALVFTLRSNVDLIWTHAILSVVAQSAQFSKIAKKLNRLIPNFFPLNGSTVLIKWKEEERIKKSVLTEITSRYHS